MKEFPEITDIFDWDDGNLEKSFIKHGVSNREAEEAFFQKPKFIMEDNKHNLSEQRFILWGQTIDGKKLNIAFTFRSNKIRIISARRMNERERRKFHEKIKEYPSF